MAKDDDDKKHQAPKSPAPGKGKEADPMATPPDTVSSPSQLPSDVDPEAGKPEKKEK